MARGDLAEARAALSRERFSYETALASCERERESYEAKAAKLTAARKALADAAEAIDTALSGL
jgi:hypothetical protein